MLASLRSWMAKDIVQWTIMPYARGAKSYQWKNGETSNKDKRKSKGVSLQGGGMSMSILQQLQHIVNEPALRLTPEDFVESCLFKDPEVRATPKDLLKHPWIDRARTETIGLEAWTSTF